MAKGKISRTSAADRCARRILAAVAVVAIVALAAWTATSARRSKSVPPGSSTLVTESLPLSSAFNVSFSAPELSQRPLYPYSVIPGGVESARELMTALANDPVAAAHYAGFDARKARVVRLSAPEKAYVSYRVGNRIYWTRRELSLAKGESVITDGVHFARTRCGNRLSEEPMQPVARLDPQPAELEAPLQAPAISVADVPFVLPMIAAPDSLLARPAPEFAAEAPNGVVPIGAFFVPPIFPSSGGSPGKPGTPPTIPPSPPIGPPPPLGPPPPPPVVPAPEPGSLLLLLAGLASLALLPRKRRA